MTRTHGEIRAELHRHRWDLKDHEARFKAAMEETQRVMRTTVAALETVRDTTQSASEKARVEEALRWHGRTT